MFTLRRLAPEATWKLVEDDFVLGACARRLFGFISRGTEGTWAAFGDDARPLGSFANLDGAKAALWRAHRAAHESVCTLPPVDLLRRTWRDHSAIAEETGDVTSISPAGRGSW